MDTLFVLLLLGGVVVGVAVVGFFGLIALAAFVYVWTHAYPWLKMVGKFVAKPANFFSLIILYLLLLVAFIGAVVVLFGQLAASPNLPTFFLLLLVLGMIPVLLLVYILVWLGEVVWIVRLIKWLFARWTGWIEGIYFSARLQLIKLKIKADTLQETGVRGKPGTGVRGKSSTGFKMGKRGMGFKDKLGALKGGFSGDVQRARSKLSRKK